MNIEIIANKFDLTCRFRA